VPVAKHGNRAATSLSGSADVLEALGVNLNLTPEQVGQCIDQEGIGFLFAPLLHSSMKHVGPVRKEIGLRTIFNILGPLTNPAGAQAQVMGVPSADLAEPLARVLGRLGCRHALLVHGLDGVDEISISAPTLIAELADGYVTTYRVTPEDVGLERAPREYIRGGTKEENARITEAVLGGEPGPRRDVVLLNAGAALVAAERVKTLREGVALAAAAIDSGAALRSLEALRQLSHQLGAGAA
jgi:anthranilate phosphoribosyltransferase